MASRRNFIPAGRGGRLLVPSLRRLTAVAATSLVLGGTSAAAQTTSGTTLTRSLLDDLLAFLYSLGHLIGQGIVDLANKILRFPEGSPPLLALQGLMDPIGILALLTIFLILVSLARKLAWILVIVGWVLIVVRLILVIVNSRL